jgi:hypothetical protein
VQTVPHARPWHPRLPHPLKGSGSPLAGHARRSAGIANVAELSYITVDEVGEGIVTLLVSEWPEVDERGRLRFSGAAPVSVDVGEARLTAYLANARLPERLRDRPLREGDAFAALTAIGRRAPGPRRPISDWLKAPVYDVTADARDAAKAAYLTAAGRRRAGA